MKRALLAGPFVLTSCCAIVVPVPDERVPSGTPAVYYVADNQFHIPDGRAFPFQNTLSDFVKPVAVRPPQAAVFGPYAFEAMLEGMNSDSMLIHLGDAADLSCPQELQRTLPGVPFGR